MWSPDRRRVLRLGLGGAAAAGLAACGFAPAYGPQGAARAVRGEVRITVPEGRIGFALGQELEGRLGRGGADAPWKLSADLLITESGLAITRDSLITRFVMRGRSRWRLEGPEGTDPVEGEEAALAAYSATESLFATRAARRDAEARLARELGARVSDAVRAAAARGAPA